MNVPRERGEFHDEHHLGTCDLHGLIAEIEECSDDMTIRAFVRGIIERP